MIKFSLLIAALAFYCLPIQAATADEVLSGIPRLVKGKLVHFDGANVVSADDASLSGIQYYAIYYSAQWCPPCHAFTPKLVDFYNSFKPSHPNFELIFVSMDKNEGAMVNYMKEMEMPWLAVAYDAGGGSPRQFQGFGIRQFAGDGIPDLVLVDASGTVLANSFIAGNYVGPDAVIEKIRTLVKP